MLDVHREIHDKTLGRYWEYYAKLKAFRLLDPAQRELRRSKLSEEFDEIIEQQTDYFQLNECLKRTLENKKKLLAVLLNPAISLHNNAAELGARRVVRKRDISLHTWSTQGTQVRDAFMTIVETAAKLGINVVSYIHDRVSGKRQMPAMATSVAQAYQ
jgi:DNA-binding protein H-NS